MYIRGLVLPPFCLSFLSSLRNVLYSYPLQSRLSISDPPSFPSAQPSQAPCPRPALPSLPSQVLSLALPRVPWILILFPDRPLQVSIVTGGQEMRVESRVLIAGYGWGLRGGRGLDRRVIPRIDKAWYGI
jgi:hypothetical protein